MTIVETAAFGDSVSTHRPTPREPTCREPDSLGSRPTSPAVRRGRDQHSQRLSQVADFEVRTASHAAKSSKSRVWPTP